MRIKLGLYSRQLSFFIILTLVCAGLYFLISKNYIFGSAADVLNFDTSRGSYDLSLIILPNSKVQIGDKKIDNNLVTAGADYDLFKYVIFSQEGIYANELNITVNLPKPVQNINELTPRVYAVHGVGETNIVLQDPQTVVFRAYDLNPNATFTIEMQLPKGYVQLPWTKELSMGLKDLNWYFWILISVIPLVITLIILFYLYHKTSADWAGIHTNKIINTLPDNLSPAEVGAMLAGKISSRCIAATFVSLAQRGKIHIIDHEKYFTFLRSGASAQGLLNYEQILMDKIFIEEKRSSSIEDVELRIAGHVFSRKIAMVYLEIYNNLFKKGYFLENPTHFQSGYKRAGYLMFFIGIAGFIANLSVANAIGYFLLVWFSIIIASTFIIKIAPQLPVRSKKGLGVTRTLYALKNFLTLPQDYQFSYDTQSVYEKYLPYAIAIGCERQWTMRFIKYPFRLPNWFVTSRNAVLLEDILNEVVPFVDFIAYKLTSVKEPTV